MSQPHARPAAAQQVRFQSNELAPLVARLRAERSTDLAQVSDEKLLRFLRSAVGQAVAHGIEDKEDLYRFAVYSLPQALRA